jgi:hypothetical protein
MTLINISEDTCEPKRDEARGVGENCIKRTFLARTLHQVYQNDQIKQDEMDRECSTYEVEEERT